MLTCENVMVTRPWLLQPPKTRRLHGRSTVVKRLLSPAGTTTRFTSRCQAAVVLIAAPILFAWRGTHMSRRAALLRLGLVVRRRAGSRQAEVRACHRLNI